MDNFFLQIMGTAMGTRMAPPYAIIFLADLEDKFLSTYQHKPQLYLRYIDDVFMIWGHGRELLDEFYNCLNGIHPSIKFDISSGSSINFLDTTVSISNGSLSTGLYRKPTDRNTLLHHDSFHPEHIKKSIVYSQALRVRRICSDGTESELELNRLRSHFLERGYKLDFVNSEIDRARIRSRESLLSKTEDRHSNRANMVPFIVTYQPLVPTIRKILKDLNPILKDPSLVNVFQEHPTVVCRQPPSLRCHLVSSSLQSVIPINGTFPCGKARCLTCRHVCGDSNLIYAPTGRHLRVRGNHTCGSIGVVYLIFCQKCPNAWYFGETSGTLRTRMNGHRQTINHNNCVVPVGDHFNLADHCLDDLRVLVVSGDLQDIFQRRKREISLIYSFRTYEWGLNRDMGFLTHYLS